MIQQLDICHGRETTRAGWWGTCVHGVDLDTVCPRCNQEWKRLCEFDFERSAVLVDNILDPRPAGDGVIVYNCEHNIPITSPCIECEMRGFGASEHLPGCVVNRRRFGVVGRCSCM